MYKILTLTVLSIFIATSATQAGSLRPMSFEEMYEVASDGKIGALKLAVRRGLNINTVNKDGDTGLCVAIKHWDYRAYNAFRAAGAEPQTACTINIPRKHYESFIDSYHIPEFFRHKLKAWQL